MTEIQLDQPTDGRDLEGADVDLVKERPTSRWNRLPRNAVPPNSRWGRRARRLTVAAVVVLGLLNIADAISTRALLKHAAAGATEANPLSAVLLANGSILYVKLSIVALLGIAAARDRPKLGFMIGAWFVAGLYAAAVLSNVLILRML